MGPTRVAWLPKGWMGPRVSRALVAFPVTPAPRTRFKNREHPGKKGAGVMRSWWNKVAWFVQAEEGPTAVEYAVMLALIVVVCIAAITALGSNANNTFNNVALNTTVST